MGFFDWLTRNNTPQRAEANSTFQASSQFEASRLAAYPGVLVRPEGADSGLDSETGRKIREASAKAKARAQERHMQRNSHREALHQVVREAMVKAGMLSASYKFKVLSLDSRGLSFLVMMDLPLEFTRHVQRLSEIEQSIISGATTQHQLIVSAVYWRVAEIMSAPAPAPAAPASLAAQPMRAASATPSAAAAPALAPSLAALSPVVPARVAPAASPAPRSAPVLADEVAALKAALAAGAAGTAASSAAAAKFGAVTAAMAAVDTGKPKVSPSNDKNLLLTGFEETEMADDDNHPVLGSTQYGDLH
jgi:hypothetical protein